MSVKQLSNGRYEVRVSLVIGGKQRFRRVTSIQTKGEARAIERRLSEELEEEKRLIGATVSWGLAVQQYLKNVELNKATSTYYSAKTALQAHFSDWNERPITEINEVEIRNRIEQKLGGSATATKSNVVKYVRGVFRVAIELRQTNFNPANLIGFKKEKLNKLQAMTRDEMLFLLSEMERMNHPWYPVVRVVYELGLRSGEGIALEWDQIDFETNTVRIDRAWCSKKKAVGPTKTGEGRTLVLNKALVTYLKELRLQNPTSKNVLPQFADWKQGKAARMLNSIQSDLGIKRTNFHSLRASFITHLLLANVPVTKVQVMVGHKDLKTTERYVRLVASDLRGATDALTIDLESVTQATNRVIALKKA